MTGYVRQLFSQVRTPVYADISEAFPNDGIPVICGGEGGTTCFNSGGRSLILERDGSVYRVKGADPMGYLTEKVAESGSNTMANVGQAAEAVRSHGTGRENGIVYMKRPFGLLTRCDFENERLAGEKLGPALESMGIENPCMYICGTKTPFEPTMQETYQVVFRLPAAEADFRLSEYSALLAKRLDQFTPEQMRERMEVVGPLYNQIVTWCGFNAGMMAASGLKMYRGTSVEQNWVISGNDGGYGIFRVDHTHTASGSPEEALAHNTMDRNPGAGAEAHGNISVFVAKAMQAAGGRTLDKTGMPMKFRQLLASRSYCDTGDIINGHRRLFDAGVSSCLRGMPATAIPEELFREALA